MAEPPSSLTAWVRFCRSTSCSGRPDSAITLGSSPANTEPRISFPFLAKLSETRIAEARDDRFFASFNLGRRSYRSWYDDAADSFTNAFHVAYIVRAVTPGSFVLPAVNVSDMYAPRVYARSGMGNVMIAPR